MNRFTPPYPPRHAKMPGPLEMVSLLRKDLLSIWPESAFKRPFITLKILGRTLVIANSPDTVAHVLVTHQANYSRKSSLMRKPLQPLLGEGLLISDGEVWQQHRALLAEAFGDAQLAAYQTQIAKTIAEWQNRWASLAPGSKVTILSEMKQLSATLLTRLLFGDRFDAHQTRQLSQNFDDYLLHIEDLDLHGFFGLPAWIPKLGGNKTAKPAQVLQQLVLQAIAKGGEDESVLGQLLKLRHAYPAIDDTQLRNELLTLFVAGYETVANGLAWGWCLMAQCPVTEQRLHEETDALVADDLSVTEVAPLAFARAIIDETLRLYPPMPMLMREVAADDTIRDKPVPAGSILFIVPWLLHRHTLYWEQPDQFQPERFLPDAPKPLIPMAYLPFGGGARQCLAQNLATTEMTLSLALLAKRYRLAWIPGQTLSHECRIMLRPSKNIQLTVTPR